MSFGINGPDSHIPAIQKSHQTTDGGAGNLGYFQQGKKKKDEEEQDVFEFSSKEEEKEDPLMEELDTLSSRVKKGWLKFNNPFAREIPEEE